MFPLEDKMHIKKAQLLKLFKKRFEIHILSIRYAIHYTHSRETIKFKIIQIPSSKVVSV